MLTLWAAQASRSAAEPAGDLPCQRGDTVHELPRCLCQEFEHRLDWFHITMRLTVRGQMVKAVADEIPAVVCREGEPQKLR